MLHFAKHDSLASPTMHYLQYIFRSMFWQTPAFQYTQLPLSLNSRLLLKGLVEHLGNNDLGKIKQFVNTFRPRLRA